MQEPDFISPPSGDGFLRESKINSLTNVQGLKKYLLVTAFSLSALSNMGGKIAPMHNTDPLQSHEPGQTTLGGGLIALLKGQRDKKEPEPVDGGDKPDLG